jgi:hypothetical protein
MLAAVALVGCPADLAMGIEEGSTLSALTFTVSMGSRERPTALPMFLVESCGSIFFGPRDEFWRLEAGDDPEEVGRLGYGVSPSGYREATAPRRLEPNRCYAVTFGAGDELYFVGDDAGGIAVITQEEAKQLAAR